MATFGVQIEPQFGYTYPEIRDIGKACEELGFTTITISDHLMLNADAVDIPCLECWSVLAGLAVDLSKVRIGPLVSCNSYRNPSLLAKMAASVDVMSGGRLEFALGAGWKEVEYNAYGYDFGEARERVDRMGEALEIIRRMWSQERASFKGRYYTVREAVCSPKPVQKDGPPVWVGGRGKQLLRITARMADGINLSLSPSPEEYRERMGVLRQLCQEEERDFDALGKSQFMWTLVARERDTDEMVNDFATALRAPSDRIRRIGENGYLGEAAGMMGLLREYLDAGVQYFILGLAKGWEVRGMEQIHDEIMGSL